MTVTLTHPTREASKLGADHGTAAASWAFDGNTADHIYRAFLAGYDDGDPQIMDYYDPGAPLSGEWADGLTPRDLLDLIGVEDDADGMTMAETSDAYESAFSDAYWVELQRVAHIHTDPVGCVECGTNLTAHGVCPDCDPDLLD